MRLTLRHYVIFGESLVARDPDHLQAITKMDLTHSALGAPPASDISVHRSTRSPTDSLVAAGPAGDDLSGELMAQNHRGHCHLLQSYIGEAMKTAARKLIISFAA